MFAHPSFFLANNYLFSKSSTSFARLMQILAVSGIAIGVAVLIIICSVFNGFHDTILRQSRVSANTIIAKSLHSTHGWRSLVESISSDVAVANVYPLQAQYAAVFENDSLVPVLLHGFDSVHKPEWYQPDSSVRTDVISAMLSPQLQQRLVLNSNDSFNITTAVANKQGMQAKNLRLALTTLLPQIVSQGMYSHRIVVAMSSLNKALGMLDNSFTEVVIELHANADKASVLSRLNKQYTNWVFASEESSADVLLSSLALQKRLMFMVLSLVIVLAAFNIIASLSIIVSERKKEVAILQTIGFNNYDIISIFLIQGLVLAIIGLFLGFLIGLPIAFNIEFIMQYIEALLGFKIINDNVFMLSYLPTSIYLYDMCIIWLTTVLLSFCASIYPAWRASQVEPAYCLRYDQ